jgi:hypothetical protein
MEDTEITLNGTDWSNLYIIDYAGGCGGEMMCDLISDKVDAQFSIPKSSSQSFAIDSFDNLYVTYSLVLVHADINQYRGYKCQESNTPFHSDETMKHNLKVNLIHRDKDISWKMGFSTEDERDSLVRNTHFTKNYILRSHRNSDWSSFTNAKVIRIYPWTKSHLTQSLMFLKRWVSGHSYIEESEWTDWDSFVEDRFSMHSNETSKNTISGTEWVFGTSDVSIKTVAGIDTTTDAIKAWQQDNIDLLAEHGISMTSTKEECIDYFKTTRSYDGKKNG